MLRYRYPLYLAGQPYDSGAALVVTAKYTGEPATRVAQAGPDEIARAVDAAVAAAGPMRALPGYARQRVLEHVARRLDERTAEFAEVLAVEAGKPLRDARGEVGRAIDTFRYAAAEAVRLRGEWLPLDTSARAAGYEGLLRRFPVGPCLFITPFNFPLNLAAHKLAPALAVGCPWMLKPASATPVSALLLGELLAETELPPGAFSILPCNGAAVAPLVQDERVKLLSFTGSAAVGWALKAQAGKKRVTLELGGNAACIVDAGANVEHAATRLVFGAFYQSGQSCISVQRIFAHRSVYAALRAELVTRTERLKLGDPLSPDTDLGPLITLADAERVAAWVERAQAAGARLLCGGHRHGALYEATLLEDVPPDEPVSCDEVFGPVATLDAFDDFDDALARANASRYGLQAGVFTPRLDHAFRAYEVLDVGGVIINDVPSWRADHMPYGGVKDSGLGREGLRWAMEEMTELKLLVLNNPAGGPPRS
jgi:acyl-CoA reductase-like NAD-dependent aldehyde dehydrogenase